MFLDSKIIADCDCSHKIKRFLLLGRKTDQPRQHIKKQKKSFSLWWELLGFTLLTTFIYNTVKVKVAQLCLTLCHPMDYSLPGSSVHGILQARIIKWEAFLFSRGSSWPSSVQSLNRVRLFATPWVTARQASLSITISQSSLKLTSIESVMPSSHLIPLSPSPPAPNPFQHQSPFQRVNSSHEVAKVLEFQL